MAHILTVNIASMNEQDYLQMYALTDEVRKRRADRYLRQEDRVRCVVAGVLLRFAVAKVFGTATLEFENTPQGKPMLKNHPEFHFNISHSGQWVVIAYDTHPVGIDVEQICWDSGKENIARRFFTSDEQEYVFGQPKQGMAERFYEVWTAKEGYLKYLGVGLQKSLASFSVLQLAVPERYYSTLDGGYAMTVWAKGKDHAIKELSTELLLLSVLSK